MFATKDLLKDIKDKNGNEMKNEPEFKYLNEIHDLYNELKKTLFIEDEIDKESVKSSTHALIGIVNEITKEKITKREEESKEIPPHIKKLHDELKNSKLKKKYQGENPLEKENVKQKEKIKENPTKEKIKENPTKEKNKRKSPRRRRKSKRRNKRTKQRRR